MGRMNALPLLIAAIAFVLALPAGAQIYQWKDSSGKVHFGDRPPAEVKADEVKVNTVPAGATPATKSNAVLTMYATSWCGYCRKARAYLAAQKIQYREVDIEASPVNAAEFKAFGGKGVPLFIAGDRRLRGFSEAGMENFLKQGK